MRAQEIEKDILDTLIVYMSEKEDSYPLETNKNRAKYDKAILKLVAKFAKRISSLEKGSGVSS